MCIFKKNHRSNKGNPVVFIPGIFGSLGKDIIPGTGKFDFGPAEFAYRPIIDSLNQMGYVENKNLFISFYDWRRGNSYSAEKYLIPIIEKAKKKCKTLKVDIVCHSMGGIVGRSYIQSNLYKFDVDKLIMIATPNSGSAKAYYFWAGGEVPSEKFKSNFLLKILWEGFIWYLKLLYREKGNLMLLRRYFPSVQELLPSLEYGDYIYNEVREGFIEFASVGKMKVQNHHLNKLNEDILSLYKSGVKIYQIIGYGIKTNEFICVRKEIPQNNNWIDGKAIDDIKALLGDGTVMCRSCNTVYSKRKYLNSDHIEILKDCKEILAEFLNRKITKKYTIKTEYETKEIYSILANEIKEIIIKIDQTTVKVDKKQKIQYEYLKVSKLGKDNYWIIIKLEQSKDLQLKIIPLEKKESSIVIFKGEKDNDLKMVKEIITDKTLDVELI